VHKNTVDFVSDY